MNMLRGKMVAEPNEVLLLGACPLSLVQHGQKTKSGIFRIGVSHDIPMLIDIVTEQSCDGSE